MKLNRGNFPFALKLFCFLKNILHKVAAKIAGACLVPVWSILSASLVHELKIVRLDNNTIMVLSYPVQFLFYQPVIGKHRKRK